MNQTKETGGPAFPTKRLIERDVDGMTLRDYFAAKALNALIIGAGGDLSHNHGAKDAYMYADAMLEARK
jgi:hypothetical protein